MRRSTLRLYSRKASFMDKRKRKRKLSIVHCQLSIVSASFWWALSEGTKWSGRKWSGRSVAVWAKRVCGAHSETKRRSSSADAALTSLVLSGSSQKERIRSYLYTLYYIYIYRNLNWQQPLGYTSIKETRFRYPNPWFCRLKIGGW